MNGKMAEDWEKKKKKQQLPEKIQEKEKREAEPWNNGWEV